MPLYAQFSYGRIEAGSISHLWLPFFRIACAVTVHGWPAFCVVCIVPRLPLLDSSPMWYVCRVGSLSPFPLVKLTLCSRYRVGGCIGVMLARVFATMPSPDRAFRNTDNIIRSPTRCRTAQGCMALRSYGFWCHSIDVVRNYVASEIPC